MLYEVRARVGSRSKVRFAVVVGSLLAVMTPGGAAAQSTKPATPAATTKKPAAKSKVTSSAKNPSKTGSKSSGKSTTSRKSGSSKKHPAAKPTARTIKLTSAFHASE